MSVYRVPSLARRVRRLLRRCRNWLLGPLERRKARRRLAQAQAAVAAFPRILNPRQHGLPAPLIISLTSWPPRFATLAPTLKSLLDQTVRADRLILWIAETDMNLLPEAVVALTDKGLDIRGCPDLRSYKKLIPCLEAYPDAHIVTAD